MINSIIICNFGLSLSNRLFLRQSSLSFFPESYTMKKLMAGLLTYSLQDAFPYLPEIYGDKHSGKSVLKLWSSQQRELLPNFPDNYRSTAFPFKLLFRWKDSHHSLYKYTRNILPGKIFKPAVFKKLFILYIFRK